MMEVVNGLTAAVYEREDVIESENHTPDGDDYLNQQSTFLEQEGVDRGQQVRWTVLFRITKFPKSLTEHTSVPYLFSPNFIYQFDFDYRARQFMIKEAETQFVYLNVPKDLMSTVWNSLEGEDSLKLICSRFKWESERVFRIVNQSNLDCLFEMCTTDPADRDISKRYLKLISCVKVDNLHEN